MEEKIIGVEELDDGKKIIADYLIKKMVGDKIIKTKVRNDTEAFQEILGKYYSFLQEEEKRLNEKLFPLRRISNLKAFSRSSFLIINFLAIILFLIISDKIDLLRMIFFSTLGLHAGTEIYLANLETKYDLKIEKQELKKVLEKLEKYNKVYEKSKMAIQARIAMERKKSVIINEERVRNKTEEKKETMKETENEVLENKKGFSPDRPSFMKNLNVTSNTGFFYQQHAKLRNFSSDPIGFNYRGMSMGQAVHAHPSTSRENVKNTSSRFNDRNRFSQDRTGFTSFDEYERGSEFDFENRKKR